MRVSGHFQDSVSLPLRKVSPVPVGYRTESTSQLVHMSWQREKYILSCNWIQLCSNVVFASGFHFGCYCQIHLFSSVCQLAGNCIEIMKIIVWKLYFKIDILTWTAMAQFIFACNKHSQWTEKSMPNNIWFNQYCEFFHKSIFTTYRNIRGVPRDVCSCESVF
jgi:hypothetical protein